jgi:hypothetical protein
MHAANATASEIKRRGDFADIVSFSIAILARAPSVRQVLFKVGFAGPALNRDGRIALLQTPCRQRQAMERRWFDATTRPKWVS